MNDLGTAENIQMPVVTACELASECWRLSRLNRASFLYTNDRLVLERSLRCLSEMLENLEIRSIDFAGTAYDPGMAPEVLEIQFDNNLPYEASIVGETILPTILWKDRVIQAGQVVVRQSLKDQASAGDVA